MLPVSLTLEGLYAYKTRQTIDFMPLTQHHLFGIFGSVGSGKSSILDAITFALYDEVERVSNRDRRNQNLFNRQSDEFLIDFQFETGPENDLYRFVVRNSRTKKGEPKTFERFAYKWESGNWLPLPEANAAKLFNLSYDNFRRTIIIPQGRFQEFLQLGGKDRTEMLKELFPKVAEFDLQDKTAAKRKEAELEMENLKGQMDALGGIDILDIQLKEDKIKEEEQAFVQLKSALAGIEKELRQLDEQRKLHVDLAQNRKMLASLAEARGLNSQKKEEADRFDLLFRLFSADLRLFDQADLEQNQALYLAGQSKVDLEIARNQHQTIQEKRELLNRECQQLPKREQELADGKLWLQINQLELDLPVLLAQQKELQTQISNLQEKKKNLDERKSELAKQKEVLENRLSVLGEIKEAEQLFREQKRLWKEMEEIKATTEAYDLDYQYLREEKNRILVPVLALIPGISTDTKLSEVVTACRLARNSLQLQLESLGQENLHLAQRDQLFQFSTQLKDGYPCPLCGSHHHPMIISTENVSGLKAENERKTKTLMQNQHELEEADRKLSGLMGDLKNLVENQKKNSLKNNELQSSLAEISQKIRGHQFASQGEEAVNQNLGTAEAQRSEFEKIKGTLLQLDKEREDSDAALESGKGKLGRLEQELAGLEGRISLLKTQVQSPDGQLSELMLSTLEQIIASLKINQENTEKAFSESLRSVQDLEIKHSFQTNQAEKAKAHREDLFTRIDLKRQEAGYPDLDSIRSILASDLDTTKMREELEEYYRQLHQVENQVTKLETLLEGSVFTEEKWSDVKIEHGDLQQKVLDKQGAISVLTSEVERLRSQLDTMLNLQAEKEKLQLRFDNLSVLYNMFRGQAFVNYASGLYLQNIVEQANQRFFRLTKQRLRLVLDGDNNFYVKDFLNGGHERLAKTLSGGQTFQASLSLALALADNVRHLTQSSRNFFFLDEGFGSLDSESLSLVLETLRQLRYENRIVGIISHVEDLQQEIDQCLRIRMDPEKGSLIEA